MVSLFCHPSHPLCSPASPSSSSSSSPQRSSLASAPPCWEPTVTHHTPSFTLPCARRSSRAGSAPSCGTTAVLSSSSALPITVVSGQVLFWSLCTTGPCCRVPATVGTWPALAYSSHFGSRNPRGQALMSKGAAAAPGSTRARGGFPAQLSQREQTRFAGPWLPHVKPGTALTLQKARGETHPDLHDAQVPLTLFTQRCFRERS